MVGMDARMTAILYINNIIEDIKEHIEIIRNYEDKKAFKNISKHRLYKELNNIDKKIESFASVSNEILNYLENLDINLNNKNVSNKLKKYDNILDNKNKKDNNKDNKFIFYWFKNKNNSCAFDCIFSIYINSLKAYVDKYDINLIIEDDDTKFLFNQFIDFINYIIIELKKQKNY